MSESQLLTTPVKIGTLDLLNRVVMAPLTRARSDPDTRGINAQNVLYYSQRAGTGLIITEATAISAQGYGWYGAPALYTDEHAKKWMPVVEALHAGGTVVFHQLWHMGRQSHPSYHAGNRTVAASAVIVPGDGTARDSTNASVPHVAPEALTLEEIAETVQDYKKSAQLAKEAGFDGVEIHAANGYLIDTFLQSVTNVRTDVYGGSFENRFNFLKEIVEAVKEVFPGDRIGVRLAPNGSYGGMGSADNYDMFTYALTQLDTYDLAYVHVMDGLGFGEHKLCQHVELADVRRVYRGVIMGNIGYTQEMAEAALKSGNADLIAFGRPFICNPDLADRFAKGYPLTDPAPYEVWWDHKAGSKGYTDYEAYKVPEVTAEVIA